MDTRDLDIVLYGATGFVGKLTAEYLAEHAPAGVRVGLAGRNADKLAGVRDGLPGAAREWDVMTADSQDDAALQRIAQRTKVLVTTVGPYMRYGLKVAEACAATGTHYADLTGEVLFTRESIDRFDDAARATGARIVHGCGFDSIPSDLGVLLLHEAVGEDLEDTTLLVRAMKGGPSGGTLASAKDQMDAMRRDKEARRLAADPYALSPRRSDEPDLGSQRDLSGVRYDDELGQWLGPFVMASINTRVVRRSNALQDWAYGPRFKYREVSGFGDGIAGRAKATAFAAGLGALMGGMFLPPTRKVLDRFVLPAPGEGPSEEARRNGYFKIEIHGRTASGAKHVSRVSAKGDPGYAATAVMLGESALCLARDEASLPDRAGVLTPATAMGRPLVERLRAAGQTFEA